jgi:Holliday junction resolvasome RuvABC DNA-binding subunit
MRAMASDGSMHPSQKAAFDHGQKAPDPGTPKSITDDPQAMQLVDQLVQMGYTPDDVAQAMEQDGQSTPDTDQSVSGGKPSTAAASLQIPGM